MKELYLTNINPFSNKFLKSKTRNKPGCILSSTLSFTPETVSGYPGTVPVLPAWFSGSPESFSCLTEPFSGLASSFPCLPELFTRSTASFSCLAEQFSGIPPSFSYMPALCTVTPQSFSCLPARCYLFQGLSKLNALILNI